MLYSVIWYFAIYSVLGWMTEVCYAAATKGKIVNRGFLNGPVCPIYGVGMVVVIGCLSPLKDNFAVFFLGSVVLTTAIEWLVGFLLEKFFHQRWWDYSDVPFNVHGYICLKFSLAWGFACVLALDIIHPPVRRLVNWLPHGLGVVLLIIFCALFIADCIATLRTLIRLNRQLGEIDEVAGGLRRLSDEMTNKLSQKTFNAMDRGVELAERRAAVEEAAKRVCFTARLDTLEHIDELRENAAKYREELKTAREVLAGKAELSWLEAHERQQERIEELLARQAAVFNRREFGSRRLLRAFADARSTTHRDAMQALRRRIGENK